MCNSKKGLCFLLGVTIVAGTGAYAQVPKPPGTAAVERAVAHPAETLQQVAPPLPHVSVDPPRIDKAPNVTVEQHGLSSTIHGDPTKPAPEVGSHGNGAIDGLINNANKTIQDAQKQLGDAAKQGVEFPLKAAEDALKIVGDAAKKAIDDIVAAARAALQNQVDDLWKKYKSYVYMAGAALIAVLTLPALIGSLVTAWIVRRIGRKREKKVELALDQAMKVIRAYGKEAGVKPAA